MHVFHRAHVCAGNVFVQRSVRETLVSLGEGLWSPLGAAPVALTPFALAEVRLPAGTVQMTVPWNLRPPAGVLRLRLLVPPEGLLLRCPSSDVCLRVAPNVVIGGGPLRVEHNDTVDITVRGAAPYVALQAAHRVCVLPVRLCASLGSPTVAACNGMDLTLQAALPQPPPLQLRGVRLAAVACPRCVVRVLSVEDVIGTGSPLSISGGQLLLVQSDLSGNVVQSDGGAVRVGPGSSLTVLLCSLRSNFAVGDGGAIWAVASFARADAISITLEDTLDSNSGSSGGGLFAQNAQVVLRRVVAVHNGARQGNGGAFAVSGAGGLLIERGRSELHNNGATHSGGGFFLTQMAASVAESAELLLVDNAAAAGGGVALEAAQWSGNANYSGNVAFDGGWGQACRLAVCCPCGVLSFRSVRRLAADRATLFCTCSVSVLGRSTAMARPSAVSPCSLAALSSLPGRRWATVAARGSATVCLLVEAAPSLVTQRAAAAAHSISLAHTPRSCWAQRCGTTKPRTAVRCLTIWPSANSSQRMVPTSSATLHRAVRVRVRVPVVT